MNVPTTDMATHYRSWTGRPKHSMTKFAAEKMGILRYRLMPSLSAMSAIVGLSFGGTWLACHRKVSPWIVSDAGGSGGGCPEHAGGPPVVLAFGRRVQRHPAYFDCLEGQPARHAQFTGSIATNGEDRTRSGGGPQDRIKKVCLHL